MPEGSRKATAIKPVKWPKGNLRLAIATATITALGLIVAWHYRGCFSINGVKSAVAILQAIKDKAPLRMAACLFLAYVGVTALCIPLEVPFALVTGALFGLWAGVFLASFASVFGATLAFLGSRYLLRQALLERFPNAFAAVNAGIEANGALFVISMRLQPVFPFSMVNVLLGLTGVKTSVFYIASQISMLFATVLFVNAGTQIHALHSYRGLISPQLVGSLLALGVLPWVGKMMMKTVRRWLINRRLANVG